MKNKEAYIKLKITLYMFFYYLIKFLEHNKRTIFHNEIKYKIKNQYGLTILIFYK